MAVSSFLSVCRINNLRVINTVSATDSVPGHHQNPSEINKLLKAFGCVPPYRRTAGLPSKMPFSREPICANFALPLRSALIQEWSEESAHASRLYSTPRHLRSLR